MPRINKIQTRRDTAANWTSTNPVLAAGEIGYETDTNKFKFGNGSAVYSALPLAASGDNEVFWLVPANAIAEANFVIAANLPFLVRAIGVNPNVQFFSSTDTLLLTASNVTPAGEEAALATEVAYIRIDNSASTTETWVAITNPTATALDSSLKVFALTSTQSVTLDTDFDAYVIGGGGGGGGAGLRASGGGGGSGYYSTGIVAAGTYTATIGAGGGQSVGGGTTSISALSAAGGSAGGSGSTSLGGNGGAGGSGGGGGSATVGPGDGQTQGGSTGGSNGASGGNGLAASGATAGTGGAGSSVTMPSTIEALGSVLLTRGSGGNGVNGGGVYGGGGGAGIYASNPGGSRDGQGAGGGGCGYPAGRGGGGWSPAGTGASGIIILVERV